MQSTLEKPVIAEISSVEHKTRAVYCVVYYLYQGPYSSSSNLTLSRAPPSWCTTPSGQGFDACFVIKLPILKEVRLTLKPLTLSFFGAYFASGYRVFLCQSEVYTSTQTACFLEGCRYRYVACYNRAKQVSQWHACGRATQRTPEMHPRPFN